MEKAKTKKHDSPMQVQHWLVRINPDTGKLYTKEEAVLHIKSFRKSNVEYWLKRGYSVQEALSLRSQYQKKACRRGIKVKRLHPEYDSVHIEYWLAKGYNEEEARIKLSERQRTFTLEKCIQRYGKEKGTKIYNDRQVRWQNTLNNKSAAEKLKINIKRNSFLQFYKIPDEKRDVEFWSKWKDICHKRNMIYVDNVADAKATIESMYKDTVAIFGKNINWFFKHCCPSYLYKIVHVKKSTVVNWLNALNISVSNIYRIKGKYNAYHMLLESGDILRSKLEIIFYNMLIARHLNIEATNGKYQNSNFRFDFKVDGKYIEIAGLMSDELYKSKVIYKRDTFGCFVLTKKREFAKFIQKVLIENDEKAIQYYLTRRL